MFSGQADGQCLRQGFTCKGTISRKQKKVLPFSRGRILADSLRVRCLADNLNQGHHNILSLELSGELWCIPYPLEFIFRSEIDLECGYIVLRSLGAE